MNLVDLRIGFSQHGVSNSTSFPPRQQTGIFMSLIGKLSNDWNLLSCGKSILVSIIARRSVFCYRALRKKKYADRWCNTWRHVGWPQLTSFNPQGFRALLRFIRNRLDGKEKEIGRLIKPMSRRLDTIGMKIQTLRTFFFSRFSSILIHENFGFWGKKDIF